MGSAPLAAALRRFQSRHALDADAIAGRLTMAELNTPALIDLVFALSVRLQNSAPVQVISGYRSPATNALLRSDDAGHVAERSLHLTGEAVDLCFEDRPLNRVRDAARALNRGGAGYYPKSGFVHVDVGRPRSW